MPVFGTLERSRSHIGTLLDKLWGSWGRFGESKSPKMTKIRFSLRSLLDFIYDFVNFLTWIRAVRRELF